MRFEALAGLLLLSFVATSASAESTYWLVGHGAKTYVFVNTSTIKAMTDGTIWTWITAVNEGDELENKGYKYSKSYEGFSCINNTTSQADFAEYNYDGINIKYDNTTPSPYQRVIPDTLGEAEKDFLCTDSSHWGKLTGATPLELYRENLRDPVKLADFLYVPEHQHSPKVHRLARKRRAAQLKIGEQ